MSTRNRRNQSHTTATAEATPDPAAAAEPVVEPLPVTEPASTMPNSTSADPIVGGNEGDIGQADDGPVQPGVPAVVAVEPSGEPTPDTLTQVGQPIVATLVTDAPLAGTGPGVQLPTADGSPQPEPRKGPIEGEHFHIARFAVPVTNVADGYAKREVGLSGEDAETLRDIAAGLAVVGETVNGRVVDDSRLALSWLLRQVRESLSRHTAVAGDSVDEDVD